MLSTNQINAQIKLLEIWKALKIDNYPLSVEKKKPCEYRKVINVNLAPNP